MDRTSGSASSPRAEFEPERLDLPLDHPGRSDEEYLARRAAIAAVASAYVPGQPIPTVAYVPEEHALWALVARELRVKHDKYACAEYLAATDRLALPTDRVPQLGQVTGRLQWLTGFRLEPVPGLVPTRTFYGALAERRFLSTQYMRHHSVPFYTPEPDIVHELVGHANMLASPMFAALYQAAGLASRRATTPAALEFFSRVFWFTLEFGVLWEGGELRTYGAGLLSSFGELEAFRDAETRPLDVAAMGTLDYDITQYQPVLFAGSSFNEVVDVAGAFFESFDDEVAQKYLASA
jgi:phenylalanine-4-hydroxylase